MISLARWSILFVLATSLCSQEGARPLPAAGSADGSDRGTRGSLTLIESFPAGTSLDDPSIGDVRDAWIELLDGARESVELGHFYASDAPGSRLEPVIEALARAGARGVRVRFLVEELFCEQYAETVARLSALEGVTLRRYDLRARTGGVMHAKYMITDGEAVALGSANFDWRSLEHILELGVVVRAPEVARCYLELFELDWRLAGGGEREEPSEGDVQVTPAVRLAFRGEPVTVWPVASPPGLLVRPDMEALPRLVELLDGARSSVRVALLTCKPVGREGSYFEELDGALRRAAARGVRVELCVADWGKRPGTLEGLRSLQALRGVEVRFVTVPPDAGGHIPFARVVHSKFMVVDERRGWVGTSNWEASYFERGRNLGLVFDGRALAAALTSRFARTFESEYAYPVDLCAEYEVPRIGE